MANREARAIQEIDCPQCGAAAGKQCHFTSPSGRPACCSAHRAKWQEKHKRDMRVEVSLRWPDPALNEHWVYNHDDVEERREFARRADAALRAGATVTTKRAMAPLREEP